MSDPVVIAAGQGRLFRGPTGAPMAVKIDGTMTDDAYSLIEYEHAPGAPDRRRTSISTMRRRSACWRAS